MPSHRRRLVTLIALSVYLCDHPEEFASYCDKLTADSDPVMWGGHSEIVALSSVLRRPIVVHSANGAPLLVGEQFGTGRVDDKSALHVS